MPADVLPFPRGVFARRVESLTGTMETLATAMERAGRAAERAVGLVTRAQSILLASDTLAEQRARRSGLAAAAVQQAAAQDLGALPLALGLGDQPAGGAHERAAHLHRDAQVGEQGARVLDGAVGALGRAG